jgi:hypothetical protein
VCGGTDEAEIVQGVEDRRSAGAGGADQIIAEAEVVVEMNDPGPEFGECRSERIVEEWIGPVGNPTVLASVDAVKGPEPVLVAALESAGKTGGGIRDMEHAHLVAHLLEGMAELQAVHLGTLR